MRGKKIKISKINVEKAVRISSKIEGLSLAKAKKNTYAIKILRRHGHAFAIQR